MNFSGDCREDLNLLVSLLSRLPGCDDEVIGEEEALPDGLALLVVSAPPAGPHPTLASPLRRRRLPAAPASSAQDLLHEVRLCKSSHIQYVDL